MIPPALGRPRASFPSRGYLFLGQEEFTTYPGPAFLDAVNTAILRYVEERLGVPLERGRDFLVKVGGKVVLGEARFLSTRGGSQSRDLRETLSFVRSAKRRLIAVAVVDGVVWFERRYVEMLSELGEDEPALTALLLHQFLESLR